jgi:hypothetical protein
MVSCDSCGYIPLIMSDKDTPRTSPDAQSAAHAYLHGLRSSVGNNASAYGFSVTILEERRHITGAGKVAPL